MIILTNSKRWKLAHRVVAMYLVAKNGLNVKLETDFITVDNWQKEMDNLIEYTQSLLIDLIGIEGMKAISFKYQLTI